MTPSTTSIYSARSTAIQNLQTLEEARLNSSASGFRAGDLVAVEITRKAYETINIHGPDAVHFSYHPPRPTEGGWARSVHF